MHTIMCNKFHITGLGKLRSLDILVDISIDGHLYLEGLDGLLRLCR
jgi:hypothetical protein